VNLGSAMFRKLALLSGLAGGLIVKNPASDSGA
jgi:hypothetical protein